MGKRVRSKRVRSKRSRLRKNTFKRKNTKSRKTMRKKTIHRKVMKNGYRTIEKKYKNSMASAQYGGHDVYEIGDIVQYVGSTGTMITHNQIAVVVDPEFTPDTIGIIYHNNNGDRVPDYPEKIVVPKTDIEPYPPPPPLLPPPAPATIHF